MGYHECLTETMHFLVEKEGLYAGNSFCVRLMTHLQKHFDKLGRGNLTFYPEQILREISKLRDIARKLYEMDSSMESNGIFSLQRARARSTA